LPRRLFRRLRHKKAVVRFLRKHGARIRRFRLARLPALRIDSELISNKTAELKGLISRRNRNSRRRVVVKTFGRWWWGKALKRRRRRSRRMFSGIFGRKRWRLDRRDKFSLKRARRRYRVLTRILQATAAAKKSLTSLELGFRRNLFAITRNPVAHTEVVSAAVPAAFLRTNLRQLIRRQRSLSDARLTPRHVNRRLDARLRRSSLVKKNSYHRALSLPTAKPALLLAAVEQGKTLAELLSHAPKQGVTRRYRRWRFARSAYKLTVQRQLRAAAVTRVPPTSSSTAQMSVKTLLQSRGVSTLRGVLRVASARSRRNALLCKILLSAPSILPVVADPLALQQKAPTRLFRAQRKLSEYSPDVRSFGFLRKGRYETRDQRYNTTALSAERALHSQQRRYRELQLYRGRPKLRLPETAVTRRRRRKAGLVHFARNSLKRPRTLLGQQRLLLPPVEAYAQATTTHQYGYTPNAGTLGIYERGEDLLPVFWRRKHSRANIKAVNRIRRKRYAKRKHSLKTKNKRRAARLAHPLARAVVSPQVVVADGQTLVAQKRNTDLALQNTTPLRGLFTVPSARAVLRFTRRRKGKKALKRYSNVASSVSVRRIARQVTPTFSRTSVVHRLSVHRGATSQQRVGGLWHARSARAVSSAERAISAWSPQLSTRNRRHHYPRVNGLPLPRRWLGFKAKRERRLANARRLERGIPQIRYTDYMPIKLQYFYGSAASAGYARFRRVHRMHSADSRWWRPNKQPIPFAHPYSRRALSATRYRKLDFSRATAPRLAGFSRLLRDTAGVALHSKFPPRTIPWRNFRYPRPRRGAAPKLLQRWTFVTLTGKTGRVAPSRSRVTAAYSPRETHSLHRFVSSRGAWRGGRWSALDASTLSALNTAQLYAAVAKIPHSTWNALREKVGSSAAYTATRVHILNKLRWWVCKRQALTPIFSEKTTADAQLFLVGLLQNALGSHARVAATKRHLQLRNAAFDTRVNLKALQYLKLRELPRLGAVLASDNLLRRDQSAVYKRWLSGVEGLFRRSQAGYIPTTRSRYTNNVAVAFGRRRARRLVAAKSRTIRFYTRLQKRSALLVSVELLRCDLRVFCRNCQTILKRT
jgi:hypothetical protein